MSNLVTNLSDPVTEMLNPVENIHAYDSVPKLPNISIQKLPNL